MQSGSNYVTVRRQYRKGGQTSPILAELVGNSVSLVPSFKVERTHFWRGSPFVEIEEIPVNENIPDWWADLESVVDSNIPALFNAVCDVIENVWDRDRFHVIFHSSGWDSRILSAAIKRLVEKNGFDWLGSGLLFLGNRWEAEGTRAILKAQGWNKEHIAIYEDSAPEDHFGPWLDFDTFWHTAPAPMSLPGNLWWYLPDWAQKKGLIPKDDECQAFSGYWANETWRGFTSGGLAGWRAEYRRDYHHVMAAFRFKLPMEYPLSHPDVLRLITPAPGKTAGDKLREAVAHHAYPEASHIKRHGYHDRKWPISQRLRKRCEADYARSWYGCHVYRDWQAPANSELSMAWMHWSLASLCEGLIRRGVDVGQVA